MVQGPKEVGGAPGALGRFLEGAGLGVERHVLRLGGCHFLSLTIDGLTPTKICTDLSLPPCGGLPRVESKSLSFCCRLRWTSPPDWSSIMAGGHCGGFHASWVRVVGWGVRSNRHLLWGLRREGVRGGCLAGSVHLLHTHPPFQPVPNQGNLGLGCLGANDLPGVLC